MAESPGLRVLDLSAGNGAVWFGDRPSWVVAVDRRRCTETVRADTRALPFLDDAFDLAVFDPPHTNFGENGRMVPFYGHSTGAEIRDLLRGTSAEASRCVRVGGTMAMKWSDRDTRLASVFGMMPEWLPLCGTPVVQRKRAARSNHISSTWWVLLANRK